MLVNRISFFALAVLVLVGINSCKQKAEVASEKPQKPKNIIFMIGDGMGVDQVYAGLTAKHGKLEIERCTAYGYSKTNSADNYVTDSAAGVTALATGKKGNNHSLGLSPNGDTLVTILETAKQNGLGTGLVATCKITHATPAGYVAKNINRNDYDGIALDFLDNDVDIFIGGGRNNFEDRVDGRNLSDVLRQNNYQVVYDIDGIKTISQGKIAGFLYDDHPPKYSDGRGEMLAISSLKAIELLDNYKKGFFIMIEASQIDWGGHDNDSQYIVDEMVDFDNVIGKVLDFAKKDGETLVVITADHECGGYAIVGGDYEKGEVTGAFCTNGHSGVMVPVFAYGPGAEEFNGIFDNTDIFEKFMDLFGFSDM